MTELERRLFIEIADLIKRLDTIQSPQIDSSTPVQIGWEYLPIGTLELSIRGQNRMKESGIATVGEADTWSDGQYLRLKNCGKHTVREIRLAIDRLKASVTTIAGKDTETSCRSSLKTN